MPELKSVNQHLTRLSVLEMTLERELASISEQLRQTLSDALASRGAAGVQAALPAALKTAQRAARQALKRAGEQVSQAAVVFADDDFQRAGIAADANTGDSWKVFANLASAETDRALLWLQQLGGLLLAEAVALQASGADPAIIAQRLLDPEIASDGRASIWRASQAALGLAVTAFVFGLDNTGRAAIYRAVDRGARRYQKQAIAAVDKRTTSCCLNVNGQIRELDEPFDLTGSPRYASQMQGPPFHYRCRTVTVLYTPAMERIGPTTAELEAKASAEQASREGG